MMYNLARKEYKQNMNSFGHLVVSLVKSILRIFACVWCIYNGSVMPLAIGFLAAEVLGILEELLDKRD